MPNRRIKPHTNTPLGQKVIDGDCIGKTPGYLTLKVGPTGAGQSMFQQCEFVTRGAMASAVMGRAR